MKFAYRFSNLLGSVYRKGNLSFTPDGNSIVSPVGNRVTVYDLRNNKSETLPIECRLNIQCVALSPDGFTMILVDEEGEASLCSLVSRSVLATFHFHKHVYDVSFSPDGKKFAVTKDSVILVFHAPGKTREFNPFVFYRTFFGAYDDNVCIAWSSDSRVLCAGCKDMNTRVFGVERFSNLVMYSMGGHTDIIVNAFFGKNSLDLYSLGQNGLLVVWKCDTEPDGLEPYVPEVMDTEHSGDELDEPEEEPGDGGKEQLQKYKRLQEKAEARVKKKIHYRHLAKHIIKDQQKSDGSMTKLTSAAFHPDTGVLVTGFQDGSFFLHEMPEFSMIHSLNISDQSIASISINSSGDWIALACSGLGQLLVWEWQSETYVLKQQGHFNNMECLAYSPDGQHIATGGDDAKVKVWNTSSGFCFVTFNEHLGGITGVTFNQNGKVVLSASLDGTVRAFDLARYRNFKTFTSPRPVQFSCLATDNSGEVVCAGGVDVFEIFVWSMQTGRLLEILTGHEGPISSLSFSPARAILASASWDKTIKLWDVFENKSAKESYGLPTDALAVAFRPDGSELAVASLDATITLWSPDTGTQVGTIEGKHDVGYSRKATDKITAKKSAAGKAFTTICYSADGDCLLAAGRSKFVCIYSVPDRLLMKKFEISCNMSFDGMEEFLDRRKMTEWGNMALVDSEEGEQIALPGVRKGDMSSRHFKPEVLISTVRFSPTGRAWAATSTEGLLIYSLDHNLVFDPYELDTDITPASVRMTLAKGDHSKALLLSFRLNEQKLIQEVLESIPADNIDVICQSLPDTYVDRLLGYVANQIETSAHLQFYLTWIQRLLFVHGPKVKQRSQKVMATLRTLQKNVTRKYEDIGKLCDHNKYHLDFIVAMSRNKRKHVKEDQDGSEEELMEAAESDSDVDLQDMMREEDFKSNFDT
ncbi:periodic tryptophan protein 2 homolog [Haliotis cracherodii]|uniref:periodic tryptophan protein 2 homolog n=1 Tax=Haliotis cracherodii TaxID=6455 RepID=UPI0039ED0861